MHKQCKNINTPQELSFGNDTDCSHVIVTCTIPTDIYKAVSVEKTVHLGPLAGGLGGHALGGGHSGAAVSVLDGAVGSVEDDQRGDAADAELGAQGLGLVGGLERNAVPGHGAVVLVERGVVVVAGGKHDGQGAGVLLLELLVELAQHGGEAAARRALGETQRNVNLHGQSKAKRISQISGTLMNKPKRN